MTRNGVEVYKGENGVAIQDNPVHAVCFFMIDIQVDECLSSIASAHTSFPCF